MKRLLLVALLLGTSFMAAEEMDEEGRVIKYRKTTVIDFEDVMLEGQIKKPTGSFLMDRTKKKFASLIQMKKDFNKELVKSVDILN